MHVHMYLPGLVIDKHLIPHSRGTFMGLQIMHADVHFASLWICFFLQACVNNQLVP